MFQILKEPITSTETDCDCNEIIKEIIQFNESSKYYEIPSNLLLEKLPPKVVDNFLDSINNLHLDSEELNILFKMIKEGRATIKCTDD